MKITLKKQPNYTYLNGMKRYDILIDGIKVYGLCIDINKKDGKVWLYSPYQFYNEIGLTDGCVKKFNTFKYMFLYIKTFFNCFDFNSISEPMRKKFFNF